MKNPLLVPELRDMLAKGETDALKKFCEETHPETVAEMLSGLETFEIWSILKLLTVPLRAEIITHFDFDIQVELVTGQNRQDMAQLIEEMPPDDRADLVQRLDENVRDEILPLIAKAEREDIRKLLEYKEGTAGAVMSTEYAALKPSITIAEAIENLRAQAAGRETIYYVYIVDDDRRLIGFVSLKDLIIAKPFSKVSEIMHKDVISINVNEDQEEAARRIQKYDLIAIPVVDEKNALVGIITHDDALDIITQEQTEDMEKFMAISGSHEIGDYLKMSSFEHFRRRVFWIIALTLMGFISGAVIHRFEATLMSMMILAFYMPMLADTGGNTGSQAATLVVRALALKQICSRDFIRIILKELLVGFLLAGTLWLIVFLRVMIMSSHVSLPSGHSLAKIASVIASALGIQIVSSTIIGAMLPLAAKALKFDPAVVASPAITTVVDITGLIIYFSVATIFLS